MINLAAETLDMLKKFGKTRKHVIFVTDGHDYCSFSKFIKRADFEYDNSYGRAEVNTRLKVVGDNWWLERCEYDGSEWWEFKILPIIPSLKEGEPWLSSKEEK